MSQIEIEARNIAALKDFHRGLNEQQVDVVNRYLRDDAVDHSIVSLLPPGVTTKQALPGMVQQFHAHYENLELKELEIIANENVVICHFAFFNGTQRLAEGIERIAFDDEGLMVERHAYQDPPFAALMPPPATEVW